MSNISYLEPRPVWEIFEQITRIPRPSKKEAGIIAYLENFANEHNLPYKKDAIGNIVISRNGSPGKETVVLQSHMDMVCEKNSDVIFDFENDPIEAYVTEDGWVKARGTTLGADDGIGMAAALALLISDDKGLPPIEALFTVDEETGLTGAFNLGEGMITGKLLVNLDSEDEGEIFIGCAGGIDTIAQFAYAGEVPGDGFAFFALKITGLKGGHSGDDINKGLANSNKLLARMLLSGQKECGLRLCRIDGGNLRNAIPREAHAVFGVPAKLISRFFEVYENFTVDARVEFSATEPSMDFVVSEEPRQKFFIHHAVQDRLLKALCGLPNGVLSMSGTMPGLVETSTNLASVKQSEKTITVTTSQRSSLDPARFAAAQSVRCVLELAGADVRHSEGYPGWNPNPDSRLLETFTATYRKLFGTEVKVRAIHAGLECGLFLQKYPELEMISIGPTLRGVHSPDERLEISTVQKFWDLLVGGLKNL
ncbi:MAG: aminoacyl-histidine dipeptidase [Rikenellaceae bacterium]|nr:aminoacyl-histidine dipeptidase [Rikenellaceae bacterium]